MYAIARGLFGVFFSNNEVNTLYLHWLAGGGAAVGDVPAESSGVAEASTPESVDEDTAGDWFIGQAQATGLEAGWGTWNADDEYVGLYYVHLLAAPQLEGTTEALVEQFEALRAVDPAALKQFCVEVLRMDQAPAPEFRIMQTLE